MGVFPDCGMIGKEKVKNLNCSLTGFWVKNKQYGWQFKFNQIKLDNTGLFFFLSNIVKGLGNSLSRKLIDYYGEENLVNILDNDSGKLLAFKGIKEKKLLKITKSWNKYKELKSLSDFFSERGGNLTSNLILRIFNYYKEREGSAVDLIRDNPYVLTKIRGIGFKTCDKIALSIGIDRYSDERIKALIDYILLSESSDNGHTYLTVRQLVAFAEKYLYDDGSAINENLQDIMTDVIVKSEDYYYDEDIIALNALKYQENYIQTFITGKSACNRFSVSEANAIKFIEKKEHELGIKLADEQYKAIFDIATKGMSVFLLCGYAGTGKSTISKIILDFYSEHFFNKSDMTCCAFTGMASKRIKDLTGYNAATIHSMLGFKGNSFNYNRNNRLPYKVILLDEASMVNLGIFYSLIRAIDDSAIFIIVGDDAQLPPIGAGNVFNDLLQHDIPKTKLTKIYRQSNNSVLTYFASFIRRGKVPEGYDSWHSDWAFDKRDIEGYFALKKTLSDKEMAEIRSEHYKTMLDTLMKQIDWLAKDKNLTGTKKIWDIQVITPMKITELGTISLNNILQERLNTIFTQSVVIRTFLLKQYDKVIHLKNKNMRYIDYADYKNGNTNSEKTTRVFNGNLGIVININDEDEEFYVLYPDNTVVIYDFDDYKNIIDLGYALTIHKTQGNQFKYVFMPIVNSFYIMLNSKLLYTAITRAIKRIYIISQDFSFKKACTNIKKTYRQTFLRVRELPHDR